MDESQVSVENWDVITPLLEERGLQRADLTKALALAAESGNKLIHHTEKSRHLIRERIGRIDVYVEYSAVSADRIHVHSAYSHRVSITSDEHRRDSCGSEGAASGWICGKCAVEAGAVDDVAIQFDDVALPATDGYRCPRCGWELLTEAIVISELAGAEAMLEAK